ncbi:MAG: hypothetical protein V4438_00950 [Patescibacteria group bacterium]
MIIARHYPFFFSPKHSGKRLVEVPESRRSPFADLENHKAVKPRVNKEVLEGVCCSQELDT